MTPTPVDISKEYGFGYIKTLGGGFNYLVGPAFTIAGIAVVIYLLIGAVKFITSGGNKDKTAEAQQMITHAIIGFILLVLLFTIMQFIPEFFGAESLKIINK